MKKYLLVLILISAITHSTDSKPVQSVTIYSGNCILYKRTLVGGNKLKHTPIGNAYGKVVLSRSPKRFSFYYDGKQIITSTDFLSDIDNVQGGEGFSLHNGYSAHRFTAERTFQVYYSPGMGDMGYEYEIQGYRVN